MRNLGLQMGVNLHWVRDRAKPGAWGQTDRWVGLTHLHMRPPVLDRVPGDVPWDLCASEAFSQLLFSPSPCPSPNSPSPASCHFPHLPGNVFQKRMWLWRISCLETLKGVYVTAWSSQQRINGSIRITVIELSGTEGRNSYFMVEDISAWGLI